MTHKMTEKEMIDNLLSANARLRRQIDAKQLTMECLNSKLEIDCKIILVKINKCPNWTMVSIFEFISEKIRLHIYKSENHTYY